MKRAGIAPAPDVHETGGSLNVRPSELTNIAASAPGTKLRSKRRSLIDESSIPTSNSRALVAARDHLASGIQKQPDFKTAASRVFAAAANHVSPTRSPTT